MGNGALEAGRDVLKRIKSGSKQAGLVAKHRLFLRARTKAAKAKKKLGLKEKAARIGQTTRTSKEISGSLDWTNDKFK